MATDLREKIISLFYSGMPSPDRTRLENLRRGLDILLAERAAPSANDVPCPENERDATTAEESGIRSAGITQPASLRVEERARKIRDDALEYAAQIADEHWPESGHVHQEGSVSCQMSVSITIRRAKSLDKWEPTEHEKLAVRSAREEMRERSVQAFEDAYSEQEEPLIGVMYGLKAIRKLPISEQAPPSEQGSGKEKQL